VDPSRGELGKIPGPVENNPHILNVVQKISTNPYQKVKIPETAKSVCFLCNGLFSKEPGVDH